ncbi:MAG: TIGR02444 family protein [Gammaproteobacteria bacterium]
MNNKIENLLSHPFWEFSIAMYSQQEAKQGCLALQERLSMNVNIILFICWLAQTGRGRLQRNDFIKITHLLNRWHNAITQTLRGLRRLISKAFIPQNIQACKQDILSQEIAAEQIEQLMLAKHFEQLSSAPRTTLQKATDAVVSMRTYAKSIGVTYNEQDQQAIQQILTHVFAKISMGDLKQICQPVS